jgi:hypothetical protein
MAGAAAGSTRAEMVKVSVLTICYRPGYFDSMLDALQKQTMPRDQWEWVVVDEMAHLRGDVVRSFVGDSLRLVYVPMEPREMSATAEALNLGLGHCSGQLVYFMADYMYPSPRCLQRHWGIYRKYGPKVIISGLLIDGITLGGKSVAHDAVAVEEKVQVGDKWFAFPDFTPAVGLRMKANYKEPCPENYITIWEGKFVPRWPATPLDWRTHSISHTRLAPDLFKAHDYRFFYAGRNDSAPLEALRAVGGLQGEYGRHGGLETAMAERLRLHGCGYLVDYQAPAYILPHPFRKPEIGEYPSADEIGEETKCESL